MIYGDVWPPWSHLLPGGGPDHRATLQRPLKIGKHVLHSIYDLYKHIPAPRCTVNIANGVQETNPPLPLALARSSTCATPRPLKITIWGGMCSNGRPIECLSTSHTALRDLHRSGNGISVETDELAIYRRQAHPKLVQWLLWLFRTFLVSPEILPGVSSIFVYDQPPSRIIHKWLRG